MTELENSISIVKAWVDNTPIFTKAIAEHFHNVIDAAEVALELAKNGKALEQPLEAVLLSDKFMEKFAEAFANTAFPSTITSLSSDATYPGAPNYTPLLKTDVFEVKELT
jgi:hypothetical protein